MIAPTCATAYAMVDHAAPHGTVTEAFAWMATAVAIGTSLGAAIAGTVADAAGPAAAFLLAGAPAAAVAVLAALRVQTLPPSSTPRAPQAATA
jgi:predicted MFS family arabinose efflux permease